VQILSKDKRIPAREIILDWAAKHGRRFYADERQNLLHELFTNLKRNGYSSKEDITPTMSRLLVKIMHNEEWETAKQWKEAVENDLDVVMRQHYPTVEIVEADPNDIILKPTMHEKKGEPEEKFLDTKKLREGMEFAPLEEKALLEELGIKKDGR
jgi:hypothetical protein